VQDAGDYLKNLVKMPHFRAFGAIFIWQGLCLLFLGRRDDGMEKFVGDEGKTSKRNEPDQVQTIPSSVFYFLLSGHSFPEITSFLGLCNFKWFSSILHLPFCHEVQNGLQKAAVFEFSRLARSMP
jgi:hypothetical protein